METHRRIKTRQGDIIYQVKNNTNFKCHNCGASMSLNNFIKTLDGTLHKQYTMEKFKEGHTGKNFVVEDTPKLEFKKPVFKKSINLAKGVFKSYCQKNILRIEKLILISFIMLTDSSHGQIHRKKHLTP